MYGLLLELHALAKKLLKNKLLRPTLGITLLQLEKDTKIALSFWKQFDRRRNKKRAIAHSNRLQIGGGEHYLRGFVNLDVFPPADLIWDCRYGLPFMDGRFKFVFSEHFLEHMDFPHSVENVLREIYRVLEPSGKLFLGVPDGGRVVRAYYENDQKFLNNLYRRCYRMRDPSIKIYGGIDLINYLFRDQVDNPRYSAHYWAYDEVSIQNLLMSIGFRSAKKKAFNGRYCNPRRKFYTLYVEAIK